MVLKKTTKEGQNFEGEFVNWLASKRKRMGCCDLGAWGKQEGSREGRGPIKGTRGDHLQGIWLERLHTDTHSRRFSREAAKVAENKNRRVKQR